MTNTQTLRTYRYYRANGATPAGALACARAELNARTLGVYVLWEDDWMVGSHVEEYDCYDEGEPSTCERAVLYSAAGDVLGSLGCIDDAEGYYRRLVEAELFLEHLPAPGDTYDI